MLETITGMANSFVPNGHLTFRQGIEFIVQNCFERDGNDFVDSFEQYLDFLNQIELPQNCINDPLVEEGLIASFSLCNRLGLLLSSERLYLKTCQLTEKVIVKQHVTLSDRGLNQLIGAHVKILLHCQSGSSSTLKEAVLVSLGALLYDNGGRVISDHRESILGSTAGGRFVFAQIPPEELDGVILPLCLQSSTTSISLGALKCVRNITMKGGKNGNDVPLNFTHASRCYDLFMHIILTPSNLPAVSQSSQITGSLDATINYCQKLLTCFKGIENCLLLNHDVQLEKIGHLMAALKLCMFFGITGSYAVPLISQSSCLYPTPLSIPDAPLTMKEIGILPGKVAPSPNKKNRRRGKKNNKSKYAVAAGEDVVGGTVTSEASGRDEAERKTSSKSDLNPYAADFVPGAIVGDAIYRHPNFSNQTSNFFAQRPFKVTSSESEFSDTEGGTLSKLRSSSSLLRQQCHATLYTVIKCTERRVILGYWSCFLPDHTMLVPRSEDTEPAFRSSNSLVEPRNLLVAILKDPSAKVRATAVAVLSYLLEGSKHYLAIADDHKGRGGSSATVTSLSFTPLSKTLSGTVHELHRSLLLALMSETNHIALTQILKCIASLVVNVPYYKLSQGLLTKVVRKVRQYITHKEVGVKIASLTCLGSVLCVQNVSDEVQSVLLESMTPQETEHGESSRESPVTQSGVSVSWLAEYCFQLIRPDDKDPKVSPLRIEALQLLGYMVRSHLNVLRAGLSELVSIIKIGLVDAESSVQLHSAKLLEEMGRALLAELESSGSNNNEKPEKKELTLRGISLAESKEIWVSLLSDSALTKALQSMNEPLIQAAACDAIATIGPQVFQMLPMDRAILCMTIPLGLAQKEVDPLVRASAIRALGIYIQYPSLREDVNFITDVSQAVICCLDQTPDPSSSAMGQQGVRIKAAWAFGNLSETLYVNRETLGASFVTEIDDRLLLNLLLCAIAASSDTDKVRANAVRSVGNLLRYLPDSTYAFAAFKETAERAVYSLILNISTGLMKVRWNACYALGNMLRNAPLLVSAIGSVWLPDMFNALSKAVKECKNFKVRINAALALSIPKERGFYGTAEQFASTWESLCVGLQNAEIVQDFSEFKYREVLTDQICMTMVHLVELLNIEDLTSESSSLTSVLNTHYETTLSPIFKQHGTRLSSADSNVETNDKMMAMARAETHLGFLRASLNSNDDEPTKDSRLVEMLFSLFFSSKPTDIMDEISDYTFPPRSNTIPNFKPTLD